MTTDPTVQAGLWWEPRLKEGLEGRALAPLTLPCPTNPPASPLEDTYSKVIICSFIQSCTPQTFLEYLLW